jgi:hypothetical protein
MPRIHKSMEKSADWEVQLERAFSQRANSTLFREVVYMIDSTPLLLTSHKICTHMAQSFMTCTNALDSTELCAADEFKGEARKLVPQYP